MSNIKIVQAYTDGSCDNMTGTRGGFGVMLKFGAHVKEIIGGQYTGTTNSRMELLAGIVAMEGVTDKRVYLKIYSDSSYVVNSIMKGWVFNWENRNYRTDTGEDRQNADLWRRFLIAYRSFQNTVDFIWIKGHNGHTENERCDGLARSGSKLKNIVIDDRNGMFHEQKLIKK